MLARRRSLTYLGLGCHRALCLALAMVLVGPACRPNQPFHGDGEFHDLGVVAYPRYRITFPPFGMEQGSAKVFRFGGVPSERLTFGLLLGAGGSYSHLIDPQPNGDPARISVKIVAQNGSPVAQADGALTDWKVARSPGKAMLWHFDLRDVLLSNSQDYSLEIRFAGLSGELRGLSLSAILEGGGNELP
jgi:hypothetical protein